MRHPLTELQTFSVRLPKEASMSWRSSLSIKPSLFWSIMLKASLNSWIWDWSNIANTLEVARWGRFLVFFPLARLLDILAVNSTPSPATQMVGRLSSSNLWIKNLYHCCGMYHNNYLYISVHMIILFLEFIRTDHAIMSLFIKYALFVPVYDHDQTNS